MDGESASRREGVGHFYGRFRLKIDAKGRLTLPSVYRRALGVAANGDEPRDDSLLVLRKGQQGFVQVIPYETWDRVVEQQRSQRQVSGVDRQWQARQQYSSVEIAGLDPKGRLTVPQPLLESASLAGEVLVVGTRQLMELWDPDTFFRLESEAAQEDSSIDDALYG